MESCNPGGTGKDRAAWNILQAAEKRGLLPSDPGVAENDLSLQSTVSASVQSHDDMILQAVARSRSGGVVVEGTSGSTGIAFATLCATRGHACIVVLPDDQSSEKVRILEALGVLVHVVPTASIASPRHYVNIARTIAERAIELGVPALYGNQFENLDNESIHYERTGPEILVQCPAIEAFCMSAGTGGTIAGVGRYLKEQRPSLRVVLVDPPGSVLYGKVAHGVAFTHQQRERGLERHRYDTIAEGIGLDRITANFVEAPIDTALQVSDQEALDMAHWLLRNEGLWVGSSSAMNIVGAVRTALDLKEGSSVVTIICDGGQRHVTRFWNRDFCLEWGLAWPGDSERVPECLRNQDQSHSRN